MIIVGCVSSVGGYAGHFTGFWSRGGGLLASATPARCGTYSWRRASSLCYSCTRCGTCSCTRGVELGTPLEDPSGRLRVLSEDRFFRTFLPSAGLPPSLSRVFSRPGLAQILSRVLLPDPGDFASNLVSQYQFALLSRLEPSCLKSLLRTIDESYQNCKNFFDGVFSFPCIFV